MLGLEHVQPEDHAHTVDGGGAVLRAHRSVDEDRAGAVAAGVFGGEVGGTDRGGAVGALAEDDSGTKSASGG